MSAYVVDDNTINKVVSYFNLKSMRSNAHIRLLRLLREGGYDVNEDRDCERLARDMFTLNVAAVKARYPHHKGTPRIYDFHFASNTNAVLTFKALTCWKYQCSEGNIPDSALYQLMDSVLDLLARWIVTHSPAYQKAPWG